MSRTLVSTLKIGGIFSFILDSFSGSLFYEDITELSRTV